MLAWKWWRDCRGRVLLYCAAAAAFGALAAVQGSMFRGWVQNAGDPRRLSFYQFLSWVTIRGNIEAIAFWGGAWMGLALGISSIGRDFASPAASFLMTRPRSRIAMLWADWALSTLAVISVAALLIGTAAALAARTLPFIYPSELFVVFPTMAITGMVVYGLTLFWTAVTRSAVRGVELSIATMLTVNLAPGALLEWWHVAWPEVVQHWMLRIFSWTPVYSYWVENPFRHRVGTRYVDYYLRPVMYHSLEPYPFAVLAIWIGIGLALTYATQKIMERREV